MKILVMYASKHGATAEIAAQIADELRTEDTEVVLSTVSEVTHPEYYDVFVLGSAIYYGHWMNSAAEFLITYESLLATRPTWLFSSGPAAPGDPTELLSGYRFPPILQDIANRIQPKDIILFNGSLETDSLRWVDRMVARTLNSNVGDFRDWDAIRAWAKHIKHTLMPESRVTAE